MINTKSPAFLMVMFVLLACLFAYGARRGVDGWFSGVDEYASRMAEDPDAQAAYLEDLEKSLAESRARRAEAAAQAAAAPPPEPEGTNWVAAIGTGVGGGLLLVVVGGVALLGRGGKDAPLPPLPPLPSEGPSASPAQAGAPAGEGLGGAVDPDGPPNSPSG